MRASGGRGGAGRARTLTALLVVPLLVVVGVDLAVVADGPASAAPAGQRSQPAAAVAASLAARAAAVRDRDTGDLLAQLDPGALALRAAQRQQAADLAQLPLATYALRLVRLTGSGDRRTAQVALTYALAGFDPAPLAASETDTYVRRGGRWLLTAVRAATPEIWQDGPLTVVHGARSLVIATAGAAGQAPAMAAEVDRDVPAVTAVWGPAWPQRAVVLLPATLPAVAALSGESGDLRQVAAVESTEAGGPGARITVNPLAWPQLSALGQQVTMRHELTHVASRAATTAASPTWLVEGLADAVGFAGSGLSTGQVAAELAAQVRAGQVPTSLPPDAAYAPGRPGLAAAYEEGWLACTLVESRVGAAGLVALYRQVGGSGLAQPAALAAGLAQVLHLTTAAFTALWLARVRALA